MIVIVDVPVTVVVVAVLGGLFAAAACGQRQFDSLARRHLPHDGVETTAVALADVEGDGDLDLWTGGRGPSGTGERVYANLGGAVFRARNAGIPIAGPAGAPLVFDADGDGDADLLLTGTAAAAAQLWRNDGNGLFARSGTLPATGGNPAVAGDVDADGDLDLVVGSYRVPTKLWLNDGGGNFVEATVTHMPATSENNTALCLVDVDGDADLDLFVGSSPYWIGHTRFAGPGQLFVNDGAGRFTDVTPAQLPPNLPAMPTAAVAATDLDGDGDQDLLIADHPGLRLLLNDGSGTFQDHTGTRVPAGTDAAPGLAVLDVSGDGVDDVVLSGGSVRCYLNAAGTLFDAAATIVPPGLPSTNAIAAGDVDGDGDRDLVLASRDQNVLLLQVGASFVDATARSLPASAIDRSGVLVDVDRDRDLDLVRAGRWCCAPDPGVLFANDGRGTFRAMPAALPVGPEGIASPLLAVDLDGDRAPELVSFGHRANRMVTQLHRNDGAGRFTLASAGMPQIDGRGIAAADVDRDGDTDLLIGVVGGQNRLLLNDGTGSFLDATPRLPVDNDATVAPAFADVDADGDADLVLAQQDWATFQNRTKLYLNDGTGTFTDATATRMPAVAVIGVGIGAGDLDGDGDVDLLVASAGSSSYPNERHRFFRNDGTGRFTDATAGRLPDVIAGTTDLELADFDTDGDLDVLVQEHAGGTRLYLNDGTGTFIASSERIATAPDFGGYAIGDVDDDGDVDVVRDSGLFLNLHRQSFASHLARRGRPWTSTIFATPGYGTTTVPAVPLIAFGPARIPIPPLGVLALDPASLVAFAPISIPPALGFGELVIPIPNDPALEGIAFHVQSLIVPQHVLGARLTNAIAETILPR